MTFQFHDKDLSVSNLRLPCEISGQVHWLSSFGGALYEEHLKKEAHLEPNDSAVGPLTYKTPCLSIVHVICITWLHSGLHPNPACIPKVPLQLYKAMTAHFFLCFANLVRGKALLYPEGKAGLPLPAASSLTLTGILKLLMCCTSFLFHREHRFYSKLPVMRVDDTASSETWINSSSKVMALPGELG